MRQLQILISARLFGDGPWTSRAAQLAIMEKFIRLGLVQVSGQNISETALGRELNISVLSCFMGHHETWETPEVLEMHGLMSRDEVIDIQDQFEGRPEEEWDALLLPHLRRVFWEYFKSSASAN
jgi:hypothetical protein